jgi:hypothetical protein
MTRRIVAPVLGILCACATVALAMGGRRAAARVDAHIHAWLLTDCRVGDPKIAVTELRELAAGESREGEVCSLLLRAAERGLDERTRRRVETDAAERYSWRRQMLLIAPALGITEEQARRARAVTRQQFVDRVVARVTEAYRVRAVVGLGIIPELSAEARAWLEGTAAQEGTALQFYARRALR